MYHARFLYSLLSLSVSLQELYIIRTQPVVEVVLESSSSPLQRSESSLSPQGEGNASISPSDYLLDINKVLLAMADNELLLNSSELSGGLFEDFSSQEDTLTVRQCPWHPNISILVQVLGKLLQNSSLSSYDLLVKLSICTVDHNNFLFMRSLI